MERKNVIMIVEEKEEALFKTLQGLTPNLETERKTFPEAVETLKTVSPQIVLMNVDNRRKEVREILDLYRVCHPQTYWALSGNQMGAPELIEFMRLGALDFIPQPIREEEFKDFLDRVEVWNQNQKTTPASKASRMISFFSLKGGVGLTLTSVNLASALNRRKTGKVLMTDFVLQHGNVAEFLDVPRQYTLLDLAQNIERMDRQLLANSVQKTKSGIAVLPSLHHPEDAEVFLGRDMTPLVKLLKESFEDILADLGHELNAAALHCLDQSDIVFLVTTPDLPSLCNAKTALETFKKLGYSKDKVKLVVNRWKMKGQIEPAAIEKNLDYPIFHKVTEDAGLALQSVNQGKPLNEISKNTEILKCFDQWAEKLAGVKMEKGV